MVCLFWAFENARDINERSPDVTVKLFRVFLIMTVSTLNMTKQLFLPRDRIRTMKVTYLKWITTRKIRDHEIIKMDLKRTLSTHLNLEWKNVLLIDWFIEVMCFNARFRHFNDKNIISKKFNGINFLIFFSWNYF